MILPMQAADETHRAADPGSVASPGPGSEASPGPGSEVSPGAYLTEAEVTSHLELAVAAEAAAATAKAYRAASEAVACWGRSLECSADAVKTAAAAAEGLTQHGHIISAAGLAQVRRGGAFAHFPLHQLALALH